LKEILVDCWLKIINVSKRNFSLKKNSILIKKQKLLGVDIVEGAEARKFGNLKNQKFFS